MSIPFYSRITRQNRSKNERATPWDSKIPLLGLDAKGHKNRKIRNEHPTSFCHIFQRKKKELFKVVEGRHINVSIPVFRSTLVHENKLLSLSLT